MQFEPGETGKAFLAQVLEYQTQVGTRIESPFNQSASFGMARVLAVMPTCEDRASTHRAHR